MTAEGFFEFWAGEKPAGSLTSRGARKLTVHLPAASSFDPSVIGTIGSSSSYRMLTAAAHRQAYHTK